MRLGKFNKKIDLLARTEVTNPDNGEVTMSYTTFASVRAEEVKKRALDKVYNTSNEGSAVAIQGIEDRVIYNIRFIPNLTTKYRVKYKTEYFNIIAIREIGNKRFQELECVAINNDELGTNDIQD